jgi:hypothetical protein
MTDAQGEMGEAAAPSGPSSDQNQFPGSGLVPKYTNWLHANVNGDVTRLVFGDRKPGDPVAEFHTSLVCQTESAVRFATLILDLVAKNKARNASSPPKQGE